MNSQAVSYKTKNYKNYKNYKKCVIPVCDIIEHAPSEAPHTSINPYSLGAQHIEFTEMKMINHAKVLQVTFTCSKSTIETLQKV